MASLYKSIKHFPEKNWYYYSGSGSKKGLKKPFVDKITSTEFINRYFKRGGKEEAMSDFNLPHFGIARANHTVSLFFFGLLLYNNLDIHNKTFYNGKTTKLYDVFQFIWFITCLAHDAAFYKETNVDLYNSCPDIAALKRHLGIEHDLTKQTVKHIPADMFNLCDAYFLYHRKYPESSKGIDHGIYAGILMYDRLVKNRIARNKHLNRGLIWHPYLDEQYAYAAGTVAVHNMWFPGNSDHQIYRDFKLDALICRKPIKFSEAPLLFLLGLVDTIEPIKAFVNTDPTFILKNIFVTFQSNWQFTLKISKHLDLAPLVNRAIHLKDWLDVTTQVKGRAIVIKITR